MRTKTVTWQGMPVEAAQPNLLATWEPDPSIGTVRRTERAGNAILRFGDKTIGAMEVAARLLLRAEGLASSAVEGLRASAADVALAEVSPTDAGGDHTAAWVADNLAVIRDALQTPGPLTSATILSWHSRLMRSSQTIDRRHVGAWRDVLGWIGGPNPRLAVHVTVPADDIPRFMEDLLAFVARDDLDPVTVAAVAHAQFETIHPFADGNGRIGRALIGWILAQRLAVPVPPPVSLHMAQDVGGYQSGLTLYRQDHVDAWVSWFADAITTSAEASSAVLIAISDLQHRWEATLGNLRSDSGARRLCDLLPTHPVVSASTSAHLLGVSRQGGRLAIDALADRGILVPIEGKFSTGGRPAYWWAAQDMLDLVSTR